MQQQLNQRFIDAGIAIDVKPPSKNPTHISRDNFE
jgi:hypothetical protein